MRPSSKACGSLHNAVFGFLMASIGIALAGLTTAAAKTGLLSKRWAVAGPVGAALMVAAAATTPAMVDGSPTFFVGVAGFLVWIAFVDPHRAWRCSAARES